MRVHNVEQGTPEWLAMRLGIPTASEFDKLITPQGKPSKQCDAYANRLVAEILMGHPAENYSNPWMDRGKELEASAAEFYEFQNDVATEKVGFITDDAGTVGCSPDRLVGEEGLLEIKCPAPQTHVHYMLTKKVEQDYYPQAQGQLLITGRKWVDLISYHPEMQPVIMRITRDETYLDELAALLSQFHELKNAKLAKLQPNELSAIPAHIAQSIEKECA